MVITQEGSDYEEVWKILTRYGVTQTWLRFTDNYKEGEWKDIESGQVQNFLSIPWSLVSEPTGYVAENCSAFETGDLGVAFDLDCSQKLSAVCQDTKEYFKLRGLCPSSTLDTFYKLRQQLRKGRKMLSGPSGWSIVWEGSKWKVLNKRYPDSYAFANTRMYPVGSYEWLVTGDGCSIESDYRTVLTLTHCEEDQFTCDLGTCVQMEKRCDQQDDCEDQSDEKDCRIVHVDIDRYLRDKPPPKIDEEALVTVEVDVDITRILLIDEVCIKNNIIIFNSFNLCAHVLNK